MIKFRHTYFVKTIYGKGILYFVQYLKGVDNKRIRRYAIKFKNNSNFDEMTNNLGFFRRDEFTVI